MPLLWKANTLHMEWCLDCHKDPGKYIRPKDQIFKMDYKPEVNPPELGQKLMKENKVRSLTDCWVCHR
jgi:hypothetical protein